MHTRFRVQRLADSALGLFLSLPSGVGRYSVAECRAVLVSLALSSPVTFFFGEGFGELLEDNSSSVGVSASLGTMGFLLCRVWLGALLACYLGRLLCQDCFFSLLGPGDDCFHVAGAQRDPVVPSSALLVSPASSPYLDANEGIGLRALESLDCSTLQLCQMNKI